MMKTIRSLLAALLVLVLALGMAGCNTSDTTWVYARGGDAMPAGVYINYMISAYSEAVTELVEELGAAADESGDYDALNELYSMKPSEVLKQQVGGVALSEWMSRTAQGYALQYYAAKDLFGQYGLALDEDAQAAVRNNVSAFVSYYSEIYDQNGIAESSVRLSMENEEMKQLLFEHLYEVGGEYGAGEAELQAALDEEYAKINYLTFNKATESDEAEEGDSSTLNERNAEARTRAESALALLGAGESFEDVEFEIRFEDAMEGGSADLTKAEPGDLDYIVNKDYTYSLYEYERSGSYVFFGTTVSEGVFDLAPGAVELLEDDSAYYVVRRLPLDKSAEEYEELRATALRTLKYDEFTAMLEEHGASLGLQSNQAALDRYTAKWLKLD